ncbi:MAG: hypothetical protein KJ069_16300 [Anaerolineae bacterium]|nr:hypothetical protein [Anaerolineae bacterium]
MDEVTVKVALNGLNLQQRKILYYRTTGDKSEVIRRKVGLEKSAYFPALRAVRIKIEGDLTGINIDDKSTFWQHLQELTGNPPDFDFVYTPPPLESPRPVRFEDMVEAPPAPPPTQPQQQRTWLDRHRSAIIGVSVLLIAVLFVWFVAIPFLFREDNGQEEVAGVATQAVSMAVNTLTPPAENTAVEDSPLRETMSALGATQTSFAMAVIASSATPEASPTPVDTPTITPAPTSSNTPTITSTPTSSSTPTVTPVVLFADDFTNGISDQWEELFGEPDWVNGAMTFSDNVTIVVGDESWTNYKVSFDASEMWCRSGFESAGIVIGLRAQDYHNMMAVSILDKGNCGAAWLFVKNGIYELIANSGSAPPGNHIEVSVFDGLYSLRNGKQVREDAYVSGKVVLLVDPGIIIDNFVVTQLSSPP